MAPMKKQSMLLGAAALVLLAGCSSAKQARNAALSTAAPAAGPTATGRPNCNGQSPVWALPGPKVYLLPGDRLYGKTKRGVYLCLSDAQAQGYKHGRGPLHHRHHRHDAVFSP